MQRRKIRLTLKSVGVMSLARYGCVAGLLSYGLIFGACFVPYGLYFSFVQKGGNPQFFISTGLLAMLVIVGGALATAIGLAIQAVLFNIISGLAGGIEVEFDREALVAVSSDSALGPQNPVRNAQDLNEMIKKQRDEIHSKYGSN